MIVTELGKHWLDIFSVIAAFFLISAKIIPPQFAGLQKGYYDNNSKWVVNPKQNFVDMLGHVLVFGLLQSFINVLTIRGTTTLALFAVLAYTLVVKTAISTNTVVLAVVAILALYADQLIRNARQIKVWKIFEYTARD